MRLFVCSCLAALAMIAPAKADGPLFEADFKKLIPGTFHVVAPGVAIDVKISKGGGISGVTDKGDKDHGRWHLAGNNICVKFTKWLDHQEKCEHLSITGNEIKGSVFSAWKR